MENADRALNQLSDLLDKSDQHFFMGNRPCSLDALVHGLLFLVMQLPFPNNDLKTILMKYKPLVKFTQVIIFFLMFHQNLKLLLNRLNIHRDFFPEFSY